jgi:hypothetical protein
LLRRSRWIRVERSNHGGRDAAGRALQGATRHQRDTFKPARKCIYKDGLSFMSVQRPLP